MPHTTTNQPVELLAPAGGPEPFAAAIAAGADAVYCGFTGFNARRKARNFTPESFEEACRAAHLAGARVYVTVNIVIKDEEMAEALELIREAAMLGADAFIIQDWGLFSEVKRLMPELETHISTQANIHDARGAAWCRDRGADRVTLSRELSVAEIERIAQEGIDLEVFAHGSICFSYSGVCTLSSFAMGGRSANRGMCAQPCRLPYDLVDERGKSIAAPGRERPLCPRDNCTVDMLGALIDAGAASLKLEGRMKAPDYVHAVTDAYRGAVDEALAARAEKRADAGDKSADTSEKDASASEKPSLADTGTGAGGDACPCEGADAAEKCVAAGNSGRHGLIGSRGNDAESPANLRRRQLKRCFNRDFTCAYFDGTSGDEMMSYERSNNRGQMVGEVTGSGNGEARIRIFEPVGKGDLLELRHDDEPDQFLTAFAREDAPAGSVIRCKVPRPMPAGSRVRLIRSQSAIDTAAVALKRDILRKRDVHVKVTARLGEPFSVEVATADGRVRAHAEGFTVEPARTRPVSADDLAEHVGRMGSTPFEPVSFDIELDEGCGMSFSAVHKVRARACDELEALLLAPHAERRARLVKLPPFTETAFDARAAAATMPVAGAASSAASAAACNEAPSPSQLVSGTCDGASASMRKRGATGATPSTSASPTAATPSAAATVAAAPAARRPVPEVCALVGTPDALRAAREAGAARIYADLNAWSSWAVAAGHELPALDPKAPTLPKLPADAILVLDEVSRERNHARLDPWVRPGIPVAVGTVSELALAAERGALPEVRACLPIHNASCIRALEEAGAAGFWLSPELTLAEIERIAPAATTPLGLSVIGRPRVMTSEHCILMAAGACIHDCARCRLRRRRLALHNIDDKYLPVRTDLQGRSRLYDAFPIDATPQTDRLLAAGVTRLLVDAVLMTADEAAFSVQRAVRALEAVQAGKKPAARMQGATPGCLFMGVS